MRTMIKGQGGRRDWRASLRYEVLYGVLGLKLSGKVEEVEAGAAMFRADLSI